MHFRQLDLNLLVALYALLDEKNITQAGKRVHLTQSAMSGALARLRQYFGDDLLVQVGRKMVPTPLGESLIEPVREILMKIRSTVETRPGFDPASFDPPFLADDVRLLRDRTDARRHAARRKTGAAASRSRFSRTTSKSPWDSSTGRTSTSLVMLDHLLSARSPAGSPVQGRVCLHRLERQ